MAPPAAEDALAAAAHFGLYLVCVWFVLPPSIPPERQRQVAPWGLARWPAGFAPLQKPSSGPVRAQVARGRAGGSGF